MYRTDAIHCVRIYALQVSVMDFPHLPRAQVEDTSNVLEPFVEFLAGLERHVSEYLASLIHRGHFRIPIWGKNIPLPVHGLLQSEVHVRKGHLGLGDYRASGREASDARNPPRNLRDRPEDLVQVGPRHHH